jgi:hypothetical protein
MLVSVVVLLGWVTLWRALGKGEVGQAAAGRLLRWLPVVGLPVYLGALYVEQAAGFFNLEPLDVVRWLWVLGAAGAGWAVMVLVDRLPAFAGRGTRS